MNEIPDWILRLTDRELKHAFGATTVVRGSDYARRNRVERMSLGPDGTLLGVVRGSRSTSYRVTLHEGTGLPTSFCTCPVGFKCKHAVALIVYAQELARGTGQPQWRRAFAGLLTTETASEPVALALEFSDGPNGLTICPLRRNQQGRWVKSGASWFDVRFDRTAPLSRHHEVLRAILDSALGSTTQHGIALSQVRPDFWSSLGWAKDRGLAFHAGKDARNHPLPAPRLLDNPVEIRVCLHAGDEGSIQVSPQVIIDGTHVNVTSKSLVGNPAHGIAIRVGDELLLAPLARRLDEGEHGLLAAGRLTITESDLPHFVAGYLPALRDRMRVEVAEDATLPEPPRPRLACRVSFDDDSASIAWGMHYPLPGSTVELGLTPRPAEPRIRNRNEEQRLRRSVPPGPWQTDGGDLLDVRLTGRSLIEFVTSALPALRDAPEIDVTIAGAVPHYRHLEDPPEIMVSVTEPERGDWFDLGVEVRVAGESIPLSELLRALSAGDDYMLLDSGLWFSLDTPELDRLRRLIEEARELVDHDGDTLRLRPVHAGLWEDIADVAVVTQQAERWRRGVEALLSADALPDDEIPSGLRAELRPYQVTGYRRLRLMWRSGLGGILADEMGLGKTLQSLAMIQAAHEDGELERPVLVVAPTTVLSTWAAEAARFTPDLKVVTITETEVRRGVPLVEVVRDAHVVLTSYTLLRLEADDYRALGWSAVLLDEAQFVKNRASKAHQAVRRLNARFTVALTGTPLENNLMDLWSLLALTAPGLFRDPKAFTENYRRPIERGDDETLARLRRRVRPLMLRRTKAAVATELPPKQVQLVPVELSAAHRAIYDRHLTRERQRVLGLVGDLQQHRIAILRSLTLLRQLSLSPRLVDASYAAYAAKIDTLVDMLGEVIDEGHRALVFSQFTGFLALVRDRLQTEKIRFAYLDGATRKRDEVVAGFREGDAPVFLISLKAGGFGLNLTEADYVFILDPWWNPAAENQAIDRTHRIGQVRPVNVYRLVATRTIEEKVVALQESKRDLFDSVIASASDAAAPLTADDIRGLLDA